MRGAMARYVLVHGAFSGAWIWEGIAAALERAGHEVDAIDLPGSGADRSPVAEATLDNYARRICDALGTDPEPAILVGHSMGGVAITQAAARCRERIALLVFVAAFMPRDGQSLLDLTGLPEGADDQVQANITLDGEPPVATMSDDALRNATMMRCSEEQIQWATARRRPQPVVPFATPVSIAAGALDGLRRTYVHCSADRAIPPPLQLRMIRENPCVEVVEIATDHSPQLSAPEELLAALERFAALAAVAP
jgi:pimeloyl-ACP methyl ester carboxylesterase